MGTQHSFITYKAWLLSQKNLAKGCYKHDVRMALKARQKKSEVIKKKTDRLDLMKIETF